MEVDYPKGHSNKDIGHKLDLLAMHVNHEQTKMNSDIKRTNKKVRKIEENVTTIMDDNKDQKSMLKGVSIFVKIILGIIGVFGTLIGIGVVVA